MKQSNPRRTFTQTFAGIALLAIFAGACSSTNDASETSRPDESTVAQDLPAATTPAITSADAPIDPVDPADPVVADPVVGGFTKSPSNTPQAKISWAACADASLPGLECGTLVLPVDPKQPNGKTFEMAVSRRPANKKAVASIVVNPGGPGASGLGYALSVANSMSEAVLDTHDIVGFDPRGVGKSMPVDCVTDEWLDLYAISDPTPDTPEELTKYEASDMEVACAKEYPDQDVYSTIRVTADMESLRLSLGDKKLTFYGASYGSYLGGAYATLYPDTVGRMVLDAAFVPEKDGYTATLIQQQGFNKAFKNWLTWCGTETKCAFKSDDVLGRWNAVVDKLEAQPLFVGKREVGEGAVSGATYASMYSRSQWGILAAALIKAENGDGSGLLSIFDSFYGRSPDGKWDNLAEANSVINCASGITQSIDERVPELVAELKAAGPLGRFITPDGFDEPCKVKALALSYSGPADIVVVGSENDPATPFSQAIVLTERMGPNAHLITFTGEGHGGVAASKCSAEAVSLYFANGTNPKDGLTCGPDEQAESALLNGLVLPKLFSESPFEDAGSLFGLDPSMFATKTYVADLIDANATFEELGKVMEKLGFKSEGTEAIPTLPDTLVASYTNAEGATLLALTIGAKGFESKDLQSLQPLVNEGQSMLILASQAAK
jgi:pimeloyl-ACP methyl ester carboxylesterase